MRVSSRLSSVEASPTLVINALAKKLRAAGEDILDFGAGEPDFQTPDFICEAATKAMDSGMTRYTATEGMPALRQAICDRLRESHGLDYEQNQVVVSAGAKQSLFNAIAALFDPGDKVVVPAPYWVSYLPQMQLLGVIPVVVQTSASDGFKLTAEVLRRTVAEQGPRLRGILLNSPGNPTGAAYDRSTLEELARVVEHNDLMVVSDEIYERLVYDGVKHQSIVSVDPALQERTVLVSGVSKSYAMTGWRIGYSASSPDLAAAMGRFQGHITSCASSISQAAALEALTGDDSFLKDWVDQFSERRRRLVSELDSIPGVRCRMPEGAFYVFPDVNGLLGHQWRGSSIGNSTSLAAFLLEEARIATVPGIAFGAEGYLRLSYATSMDNIIKGMKRFRDAVGLLDPPGR